jgi:hypothetical protein
LAVRNQVAAVRRRITIAPVAALLLAACDGPHEEAGEKADVAAGLTDSASSLKSGPHERLGERLDAMKGDGPVGTTVPATAHVEHQP